MGLIADMVNQGQATAPVAEDPSFLGEVSKGFSRGLRDTGAAALQGVGMGAEYLGRNDAAATLRGGAQSLRDSAAQPQFAPEAATFDEAKGVGQTLRWAGSKVGEMAPMVGAGAVGGLVGGIPGAMATMVPGQFGAIDQEQQANPALAAQPIDKRMGDAALPALASSAAMTLPVGSLIGKLGVPASRSALGAMAGSVGQGAVTGGVGMGSADALVQHGVDPSAPTDWHRSGEAALGGAVAVGGMHALHAVPSYAMGKGSAIGEAVGNGASTIKSRLLARAEQAKTAATEGLDAAVESPAGQRVTSIYDDLSDMASNGYKSVSDYATRIAKGMPVGVDDAALAKMTPEQLAETIKKSDPAAIKWASEKIDSLMDKVSPENQAKLREAAKNLDDHVNRATVAAVDLGQSAVEHTRSAVTDALAWSKKKLGITDDPTTQKSEDYTGTEKAIVQGLGDSGLLTRRPELVENDRDRMELGSLLRSWLMQMAKGPVDPTTVKHIENVLGDDTVPVMNSVRRSMRDSLKPGEAMQFLTSVRAVQDARKEGGNVLSGLSALLQPHFQNTSPKYKKQMAEAFVGHARGEHMSGPEARGLTADQLKTFSGEADKTANDSYEKMFGSNADAARALVEKAAKVDHGDEHTGSKDYNDDGDEVKQPRDKVPSGQETAFDKDGKPLGAEALDEMRFGLGARDKLGNSKMQRNGQPYLDPKLEKTRTGTDLPKEYTSQHLEDLKTKYPDKEVTWEPSGDSKTHGHIMVRDRFNPEDVNDETIDKMRLDTKKYSKSDSRMEFDTGVKTAKGDPKPLILDTLAVSREMGGRNPQGSAEADLTYAHRLSRQFMDGVSALTSKFGAVPQIPKKAVIGYVAGEPFTWEMAQKMRKTTHVDAEFDRIREQLQAARTELLQATASQQELGKYKNLPQINRTQSEIKALRETIKELGGKLELEKNIELSKPDGGGDRIEGESAQGRMVPDGEGVVFKPRDKTVGELAVQSERESNARLGNIDTMAREVDKGGLVHEAFAKGKDESYNGARLSDRAYDRRGNLTKQGWDELMGNRFGESTRPTQPDNIVRSNQDGTPRWIDTSKSFSKAAADMGNELMARSSAAARSLGAKLVALSKPEVMAQMNDHGVATLARAYAKDLTNTERAKILNPLVEHFLSAEPTAPPAMSKPRTNEAAQAYGQDYAALKGRDVTLKVPVADAEGNIKHADLTRDAQEYMHELDRRAEALEEVRKCLG